MTQKALRKHDSNDPWPAEITPLSDVKRELKERGSKTERDNPKERESARTRARRELSFNEKLLDGWMVAHDLHGSEELIRDYGLKTVLDALFRDGIVTWEEGVDVTRHVQINRSGKKPRNEYNQKGYPTRRSAWIVNPKWRSSGGFLVSQLRKRYGSRKDE